MVRYHRVTPNSSPDKNNKIRIVVGRHHNCNISVAPS